MSQRLAGVFAPVVTPFKADLSPDPERLARHCHWLASQDCDGFAVFGTTSEANSLSIEERMALLETLVRDGIAPARLMPGSGCCALSDSVRLTSHAVKLGCGGVLMLPPFYYKDVSDDGLFKNYAEVIERVGDSRLRVYLYHIPQMSQIAISLTLIERLLKAYPGTVVGIKDSSGDWENTEAMLKAFPGFDVFVGSEPFLLANMRNGGVGCISATANVNSRAIHKLYEEWRAPGAEGMQQALIELRAAIQKFPAIPALKTIVAHYSGDPVWANLRPPLMGLTPDQASSLLADLKQRGFAMPGLRTLSSEFVKHPA